MISGSYETVSPNKGMGILRKKPLKSGTEEHLIGCLESKTLPRSVVKFVHSSVRIFLHLLYPKLGLPGDAFPRDEAPRVCQSLSLLRTITSFAAIAAKFPADGGFVHFKLLCYLCLVEACFQ